MPVATSVEVRCSKCKRLLMRVSTKDARIEVVCPDRDCRRMQTVNVGDRG